MYKIISLESEFNIYSKLESQWGERSPRYDSMTTLFNSLTKDEKVDFLEKVVFKPDLHPRTNIMKRSKFLQSVYDKLGIDVLNETLPDRHLLHNYFVINLKSECKGLACQSSIFTYCPVNSSTSYNTNMNFNTTNIFGYMDAVKAFSERYKSQEPNQNESVC